MKGSVTKYTVTGSSRPRWRYRIDAGKDEQGRRIQEGRGGYKRQDEAADAMRKHMDELRARQTAASASPRPARERTLAEWIDEWLATYGVDRCQPKTLERYRQLAGCITSAKDGPIAELACTPLPRLKPAGLEAAFYGLLKMKAKRREHISARTVRHIAGLINVALNKAFRLDLIAINPLLQVELPTVKTTDAKSLTPGQIRSLRECCRGDWTFGLVELALATGARRGELLALEWKDLDWASATLTISKSLEQTRAGLRTKLPKNGKSRPCRLPQSAMTALQFIRDQQAEHRRMFADDYHDHGLILCRPDGSHHEPDLVSQVMVRRLQKAGISGASLHTLRHSHASNLLSKGLSLPSVSARLGHADANVTARVYSHALPADDERAADILGRHNRQPGSVSLPRRCARVTRRDMKPPAMQCKFLMGKRVDGSADGNRMGYVSVHLDLLQSKLFIFRSPRSA